MQANLAFEWEVHRNTSLTVTYLFVDGANLPRSIDRNLGTAVDAHVYRGRVWRNVPLSFLRGGSLVRQFHARDWFRVDRRVPLQRPHRSS